MPKFSAYFLLALVLLGCEQVVELDVNQAAPQLVIEGLLTNKDTLHYVKISRSMSFYNTGFSPVTNAQVTVTGNGNSYSYRHNPFDIDTLDGYYFSDNVYAGVVNKVYQLQVQVQGTTYLAADTLRPVTTIDSLAFKLAPNPSKEDLKDGKMYQVLLYAAEPQKTRDYYQFSFYRNKQLIAYPNNIYVFSDIALGPTLNGLPSPVLYRKGELAGVEIYSLSREQYVFYEDLSNILTTDGGMFSPPPANPRNTFTHGALGLWQVSAMVTDSIKITP